MVRLSKPLLLHASAIADTMDIISENTITRPVPSISFERKKKEIQNAVITNTKEPRKDLLFPNIEYLPTGQRRPASAANGSQTARIKMGR